MADSLRSGSKYDIVEEEDMEEECARREASFLHYFSIPEFVAELGMGAKVSYEGSSLDRSTCFELSLKQYFAFPDLFRFFRYYANDYELVKWLVDRFEQNVLELHADTPLSTVTLWIDGGGTRILNLMDTLSAGGIPSTNVGEFDLPLILTSDHRC